MNLRNIGREVEMEGSGWKVFAGKDSCNKVGIFSPVYGISDINGRRIDLKRGEVHSSPSGPGFHVFQDKARAEWFLHWLNGYSGGYTTKFKCFIERIGISNYRVCSDHVGEVFLAQEIYIPTQEELLVLAAETPTEALSPCGR